MRRLEQGEYEVHLLSEDSLIIHESVTTTFHYDNQFVVHNRHKQNFSRSHETYLSRDEAGRKDRGLNDVSILVGVQKMPFDHLVYVVDSRTVTVG